MNWYKLSKINMANNNAHFIFNKILGYNRDLWDNNSFNPIELKKRIEYYEGETKLPEGDYAGQGAIQISPEEAIGPLIITIKNYF